MIVENGAVGVATLNGPLLRAIGDLWGRQQKKLLVRFDGVSMRPSIQSGEEVLLVCDGAPPRIGDVVVVAWDELLTVHRVICISRDGRWVITRGDAHRLPDRPSPVTNIIGRVVQPNGQPIPDAQRRRRLRSPGVLRALLNANWWLTALVIHIATLTVRAAASITPRRAS